MKKIILFTTVFLSFSVLPMSAFALINSTGSFGAVDTSAVSVGSSGDCTLNSYSGLINCSLYILNSLIPIIIALIVVWVLWSAFQFTRSEGEGRESARSSMVWGIVGLFVAVSIYGLVAILTGTFFAGNQTNTIKPVGVSSTYITPPTP